MRFDRRRLSCRNPLTKSAIMIYKSIFSLEFDPEDNPNALDNRKQQIKLEINVDHGCYDDPMNDHVI